MDFEKKAKLYKVCCDILKKEIENLTEDMLNEDEGLVEYCPTVDYIFDSYDLVLVSVFE